MNEFDAAKKLAEDITENFMKVKNKRTEKFMAAFEQISGAIDGIYKELTAGPSQGIGGTVRT